MTLARPDLWPAYAVLGLTLGFGQPACAATLSLGFDEVPNELSKRVALRDPGPGGVAGIYAGFTWSGWQVEDYGYYNGLYRNELRAQDPPWPGASGDAALPARPHHLINVAPGAVNGSPVATVVTNGLPFRLEGLYLTGFRVGSESGPGLVSATARQVTVEGFRHGQRVGSSPPVDLSLATQLVPFRPDWSRTVVDELRFTPDFYVPNPQKPQEVVYRSFLLDSLSVQPVPLPAASGLLLVPLLGLAGAARRRGAGSATATG